MNVLLLLDDGWSARRVCEALFIDDDTVRHHRVLYEAQGRAGVERLSNHGGTSPLSRQDQERLAAFVEATVPQTSREVCDFARERFAQSYTHNAMSKLLKRLGFVHKKPKSVPAKADEQKQRAFVEDVLAPLMTTASAEAPVYFVDATHPSYTGRPAHGWIRRGQTVELLSNHGRSRININGALSWPDRQIVYREEDLITSQAMIRLFDDLAERHPQAAVIPVVLDNAKYNVSREIRAYLARPDCRIKPIYLPSYAPNLNLIERFWHFMKRKVLFNRSYAKLDDFKQAFRTFLDNLGQYGKELGSLIIDKFHFIGASAIRIRPAEEYTIGPGHWLGPMV